MALQDYSSLAVAAIIGLPVLIGTLAIWQRMARDPLAGFPGPRLAAFTDWYWTYYEVWKDGATLEKLQELHRRYGNVVRISPNELHFSDPRAYADIYTNGTKFTKDPRLYMSFHEDESSFTFTDPREAKTRRDILAPMFSRKSILKLEGVVTRKVDALVSKILSYEGTGKPVNMHRAYRSATLDLILSYCFAREYGVIAAPDFTHFLVLGFEQSFTLSHILKNFPWSFHIFILVGALMARISKTASVATTFAEMSATIDQLIARPELMDNEEHDTIYHHLLVPQPDKGQPTVPSKMSLLSEAINLTAAGSDTVGNAVTVGTFHILSNPPVRDALLAELQQAWPDKDIPIGYEVLEKLPYLTAVVKESLRLSHGVVLPAPRVVGPTDAVIAGYTVPRGTVVAMGCTFMHYNPDVFPEPYAFRPDRWLQADTREQDQHIVAFSKGPRSCLGQNLAWCELYLLFGYMFRKVELSLHDTTITDMAFRCHFTPTYRGKKLHCTIKARTK